MVVRTRFPLDRLTIRVLNVGVPNQVEVCVPGGCTSGEYASGEKKILELPAGQGFPYEDFGERSYCYLVTIAPKTGEIPLLARRNEGDTRYLGAFVHIEPDPYPGL
jgi:hypothetical protein